MNYDEKLHIFYSIYLHIFLLFCFLSIFFWLVISKAESNSLNNEIINNMSKGIKNVKVPDGYLEKDQYEMLKKSYDDIDITVETNNKLLHKFNIAFIIMFFVAFLVTVIISWNKIKMGELIIENIIVLIIVGAIEYYFFINIVSEYVPVKPSYLPTIVKEKLDEL